MINEKEYMLLNIVTDPNSAIEDTLDNIVLKDLAFSSKYKIPKLVYNNVLIEIVDVDSSDSEYFEYRDFIQNSIVNSANISENTLYSLYITFKNLISMTNKISYEIVRSLKIGSIGITYTDGSSSKLKNKAGYASIRLTEESSNGVFDDFTGRTWNYAAESGMIDGGTNNVGELTGVKRAIENLDSHEIQLIISDSNLSMRSFREYIHNWKNNGWKAYNKKPIKNKELIQETYAKLNEKLKNKIILFKWTKAHAKNGFNELCDELAKKERGVNE